MSSKLVDLSFTNFSFTSIKELPGMHVVNPLSTGAPMRYAIPYSKDVEKT